MRTIEVCYYEFNELSDEAKERALRDFEPITDYIWSEAHETVKEFHDLFGTREGLNSWLDIRTGHIDDCILELTGFRLQKYLWNNFGHKLFRRKYLKNGGVSDKIKPYHPMRKQRQITNKCPNQGKWSISYYSNIQKGDCCVLTGVCYDHDILDPIYKFLESRDCDKNNVTFEDLLKECVDSLRKSIEDEIDYRNSDEAKIEDIEANEYEFDEYGRMV